MKNITVSGSVLSFAYPDDTEEWIHGYSIILTRADGSKLSKPIEALGSTPEYWWNAWMIDGSIKLYIRSDNMPATITFDLLELAQSENLLQGEYKISITSLGKFTKPDYIPVESEVIWDYTIIK